MDIIESLRIAMRQRIFAAEIIPPERYQEEFKNVPDEVGNSYYIRETVIDMGRIEPSQNSELQTVLCEYDVIVSDGWLNPTVTASNIVAKLRAEFDVKKPDKINITLSDQPDTQAWVREPVTTAAAEQDSGWYRLPVFVYIECLIRSQGA